MAGSPWISTSGREIPSFIVSSPFIASDIDSLHAPLGIARTGDRAARHRRSYTLHFLRRKRDPQCADILVQTLDVARARNGDDVGALRKQPRQRELRRRATLLRSHLLDLRHQFTIAREVLTL